MADRLVVATAPQPGAIAIIQVCGDVEPLLAELTGAAGWPVGRARLVRFADIDAGIAARLADDVAQLMPHGGPRVVQRLTAWLAGRGVVPGPDPPDPTQVYPEAADRIEALALAAVARAASPLAVEPLLAQPARWRTGPRLSPEDRARSRRLDRLITPPIVVLAGAADVGKSTLCNALLGRSMSITAEGPGTTRDYTSGRVDLGGLVVDWHDTPGARAGAGDVERAAQALAAGLMRRADLVIAMTDAAHDWPDLPRAPGLRVAGKADLEPRRDADVAVSASEGTGLSDLVAAVRRRLVPDADLEHPGPWLFDERLEVAC